MRSWIERRWYSQAPAPIALRPLAALFARLAAHRRQALQHEAVRVGVPVIVVGNISLGGTGKTPFTIWLVERLREWGFRPGVISRGYGGRAPCYPFLVHAHATAAQAGDEPLLIAQRCGVPVMVDPDRVAAAQALIARAEVDVLVADDGLQHYRLARDLEICVVDGCRGFGNGALLPAGPLREPVSRLAEIALVIVNGGSLSLRHAGRVDMQLQADVARPLRGQGPVLPLREWRGQRVHAVAGIGHPARFFDTLRAQGIEVIEHAFADHHAFVASDVHFDDGLPVLMTDKDAIKCGAFAGPGHYAVPVDAVIDAQGEALVKRLVQQLPARRKRPG